MVEAPRAELWPELTRYTVLWRDAMLRNDGFDNLAAYLGQPLLAAQVHVTQGVLVQTHLVKQGGVQVAEMHRVFGGLQPNTIGGAVDRAALESAAGHPHR